MNATSPNEEAIFNIARRFAGAERESYVKEACGADLPLQRRMMALLAVQESFLATPPPLIADDLPARNGDRVGPYTLLEVIGEGGFGIVHMAARDGASAAVKVMKPGMDSKAVAARFDAERAALARMDHANIAKFLDSGVLANGRPWFAMELVRGPSLVVYCDRERLNVAERLALAIEVCRGVEHAHQKGIIHRDIKPTNVLVAMHAGRPLVKVIDFGIAKALHEPLTEQTLHTGFARMIGTPRYMSPEQMDGHGDVDTRTDIHALGVLIYELLTGSTPFAGDDFESVCEAVKRTDPPRPSQRLSTLMDAATVSQNRRTEPRRLSRLLAGDLDWIVMKCLEKDRHRRYATAGDLAKDLERHLAGEAVEARPPSVAYRAGKFLRRNRVLAVSGSLVAATLVAGIIGTSWGLVKADRALAAESKRAKAEEHERKRAVKAEAEALDKLDEAISIRVFLQEDLLSQAGSKSQADRRFEAKPDLTVREALDRAAERVGEKFRERPLMEAKIRHTIGSAYREVGEPRKAIAQLRKTLELFARTLGEDRADTLVAGHDLAGALIEDSQYKDAAVLLESIRDRQQRTLGPDHAHVFATLNSLAVAWHGSGQPREALTLLQKTVEDARRVFGPTDPITLKALEGLATLLQYSSRPADGIATLEQILELRSKSLPADHPDVLHSRMNLALSHLEANHGAIAVEMLATLVEAQARVHGPRAKATLETANALAGALDVAGRTGDAITRYEELLAICKADLDANNRIRYSVEANLGAMYLKSGKHALALPLLESSLAAKRRVLGESNASTLQTAANLGVGYFETNRPNDAVPLLDAAYRSTGDFGKFRWVGSVLAKAHHAAGRRERAAAIMTEVVADDRKRAPAESLELASMLSTSAAALVKMNSWSEAEALLREALAIRQAKEPDRWTTFNTQSLIGTALVGRKEYAAAEPFLIAGYQGMKAREATITRNGRNRVIEALERLIACYEAWGRADDVTRWKAELAELKK